MPVRTSFSSPCNWLGSVNFPPTSPGKHPPALMGVSDSLQPWFGIHMEWCSFPVGGEGATPGFIEYVPLVLLMLTSTVAFDSLEAVPSVLWLPSSAKKGFEGFA